MKKQPTPLRSHHQLEQCLADSLGPWLRGVCATLEPYHQLLPTEIVTHRTRPRFSIHLGTNRYAHVPTRVAASDVVLLVREKTLNLEILDVSGEEKLRCMGPIYYKEAKAALCVFDLTSEETFQSLHLWIESIRNSASDECIFIILGNKVDLEDCRQVSTDRAAKYATSVGATYFEVSAVTGIGLLNVVIYLSKHILYWNDCSSSYAAKRSIISNSIEYISPKKEPKIRRFSFPVKLLSILH
ncbi:ras-related protein Rab-22A [Caerostris darwini]|uniref:Ras-related protein Rab-22A n=1 Tax=Caerostris darwini TaxID=1538125 RepID=A0AAV4WPV2_9ARAC|nr:ras-related protein Rab-22A [Caerostris darwini]